MPKLTVNGNEVEFEKGMTVLQACELAGEEIPRFCYHERLSIAGNCRMCLVQIEGGPPKPAASCAMPAGEGMVVHTNTPMVKKAREGVMEFLLINHPLDCPICDQGGECDLQDQSMTYGAGSSRFTSDKRAVKEKHMGPLIKTQMTRCIHCTRCVRFSTDVAGVEELGALYRGENMEITTYLEKTMSSELSGNVIDLCPVGALTSRPYAFKARPWELRKVESIDVLDAVGSNIRVDYRGNEVMRILPRLNEEINEEWIADKTRFACDGLKLQRLDTPYVKKNGKLKKASWEEAYGAIKAKISSVKADEIAALAGNLADCESMFALKDLMVYLGSNNFDCRQDGSNISNQNRSDYIFNSSIAKIDEADACLIIGANPRVESPIINARILKAIKRNKCEVALIGPDVDLSYEKSYLGNDASILNEINVGKHDFSKVLDKAKKPMVIIGQSVFASKDNDAIINTVKQIAEKYGVVARSWNGYNVLHNAASRVGGLDIGFVPNESGKATGEIIKDAQAGKIKFLYLLGADEIAAKDLSKSFVVYQGHHGDKGAHLADVILPGSAYTEKNAIYVNTEGRPQIARKAVRAPGEAKEDAKIILELKSLIEGKEVKNVDSLRSEMLEMFPVLKEVNKFTPAKWVAADKKDGKINKSGFENQIENYYMTDPISRVSKTMAACTKEILNNESEAA